MSSIGYPNTVAPAAERRTLILVVVAALHAVVIYAIMAGLNIVPVPDAVSPILFHFIPERPIDKPQPPIPSIPHKFERVSHDTIPKPFVPVDRPADSHEPFAYPQLGDAGGDGTDVTFEGPSAIAGTHTIPPYPVLDRRLGHEGNVIVSISLDAQGAVTGVAVARSSGYEGLDQAAMDWVRAHWLYKPARRGDAGVPATVQASVVFRLTEGPR